MTPTINQAELRAIITGTPDHVRVGLAEAFTANEWKSLAPENDWNAEALMECALTLHKVAESAGHKLRIPLTTDVLIERIKALPLDLADAAAFGAQTFNGGLGVPHVQYPNRWTLDEWRFVDELLDRAETIAATRHRRVMATLGMSDIPVSDDYRHTIVGCITDGRTESSKQLTGPEVDALDAWATRRDIDINTPPPTAYVPDWSAEAKRLKVKQTDLLKSAKEWYKLRKMPAIPKSLAEVTDCRAIARVLHGVDLVIETSTTPEPVASGGPTTWPPDRPTAERVEAFIPAQVGDVPDEVAAAEVEAERDTTPEVVGTLVTGPSLFREIVGETVGPLLELPAAIDRLRAATIEAHTARQAVDEILKAIGLDKGAWF